MDQQLTAARLVAANLRAAREQRSWTQEQAAEALAPYVGGVRWSKASWSAAERGRRHFTAAELLAFSACFKYPVVWFFLPPIDEPLLPPLDPDAQASARQWATLVLLDTETEARLVVLLKSLPPGAAPAGMVEKAEKFWKKFSNEVATTANVWIAEVLLTALRDGAPAAERLLKQKLTGEPRSTRRAGRRRRAGAARATRRKRAR